MTDFQQIRSSVQIEEVAKWLGIEVRCGKAKCPFHNDQTPSLSFKDGRFKCFGCDASGDAIDLVAKLRHMSTVEAANLICETFHLSIAKKLTERGIPSPAGKPIWYSGTVESILTNEKYKGDALLQKTFCVNFLTKEMKRNEGELPQYYVEQSHPAIVSTEVFDEVQQELKRRREARYVGRSGCFSSKIICGECGSYYGRKVWHSNDKYRAVIWRCQHKYDNGEPCKTPHETEDQIKAAFVAEMNRVIANKDQVLADIGMLIATLTDTRELEEKESAARKELEAVSASMRKLVDAYAHAVIEQREYDDRYAELLAQSRVLEEQIVRIGEQREQRRARKRELDAFYKVLKSTGPILEFDEELWNVAVESVLVHEDGKLQIKQRIRI